MCQAKPECDGVTFPIHTIVSPAQTDIPSIYQRGYHALLFASHYEAWGMPVMEAMASGIPVVTSACMGVDMFCHSGFNCLMVTPTDTLAMAKAVCTLIENTEVRNSRRSRRLFDLHSLERLTACASCWLGVVSMQRV
jgi:glycosyltransferase involved in cell wall biosynthesis